LMALVYWESKAFQSSPRRSAGNHTSQCLPNKLRWTTKNDISIMLPPHAEQHHAQDTHRNTTLTSPQPASKENGPSTLDTHRPPAAVRIPMYRCAETSCRPYSYTANTTMTGSYPKITCCK
jgi:hypothetical protein